MNYNSSIIYFLCSNFTRIFCSRNLGILEDWINTNNNYSINKTFMDYLKWRNLGLYLFVERWVRLLVSRDPGNHWLLLLHRFPLSASPPVSRNWHWSLYPKEVLFALEKCWQHRSRSPFQVTVCLNASSSNCFRRWQNVSRMEDVGLLRKGPDGNVVKQCNSLNSITENLFLCANKTSFEKSNGQENIDQQGGWCIMQTRPGFSMKILFYPSRKSIETWFEEIFGEQRCPNASSKWSKHRHRLKWEILHSRNSAVGIYDFFVHRVMNKCWERQERFTPWQPK